MAEDHHGIDPLVISLEKALVDAVDIICLYTTEKFKIKVEVDYDNRVLSGIEIGSKIEKKKVSLSDNSERNDYSYIIRVPRSQAYIVGYIPFAKRIIYNSLFDTDAIEPGTINWRAPLLEYQHLANIWGKIGLPHYMCEDIYKFDISVYTDMLNYKNLYFNSLMTHLFMLNHEVGHFAYKSIQEDNAQNDLESEGSFYHTVNSVVKNILKYFSLSDFIYERYKEELFADLYAYYNCCVIGSLGLTYNNIPFYLPPVYGACVGFYLQICNDRFLFRTVADYSSYHPNEMLRISAISEFICELRTELPSEFYNESEELIKRSINLVHLFNKYLFHET